MKPKSKIFSVLSVQVLLVFTLSYSAGFCEQRGESEQNTDVLKRLAQAGISRAELDTLNMLVSTSAPTKQINDRIVRFWNDRYKLLSPEEQAFYQNNLMDSLKRVEYLSCRGQGGRESFLKKYIKKRKQKLLTTEQERAFYYSFKLVASDDELKEFLILPDPLREEWLFTFWKKKDPDPTTEENEFKIEFDRRVEYALYYFWVPFGQLKPWDDRGDVYILYGEPDDIEGPEYTFDRARAGFSKSNPTAGRSLDAEVWHYSKYGSFQFQEETPGVWRQEVYRRSGQDSQEAVADFYETVMDRVVLAKAEFAPDFGSPLDFPWNYWKFCNQGDTYDVRVNMAVPIEKLGLLPDSTDRENGWLTYKEKVVISDQKRRTVTTDSVWVKKKVSRYLNRENLLLVNQYSCENLLPGFYNIAISVKDSASKRMGIYQDTSVILVPHINSQPQEKISQLIMADSIWVADSSYIKENGKKFVRNGLVIKPRPGNVYVSGQTPNFYCEIYDLKKDENNTTHCKINYYFFRRDKNGEYVLFQGPFEEKFSWPSSSHRFIRGEVNPAKLSPGEYIIRIDIHDLNDPRAKENEIRKTVAHFKIS